MTSSDCRRRAQPWLKQPPDRVGAAEHGPVQSNSTREAHPSPAAAQVPGPVPWAEAGMARGPKAVDAMPTPVRDAALRCSCSAFSCSCLSKSLRRSIPASSLASSSVASCRGWGCYSTRSRGAPHESSLVLYHACPVIHLRCFPDICVTHCHAPERLTCARTVPWAICPVSCASLSCCS